MFISSESIGAGNRWSRAIDSALEETDFGLIVVTSQNKEAPWIHYEAGALAKNVSTSKVIPILCDVQNSDIAKGPLINFQTVQLDKSGFLQVVSSLHEMLKLTSVSQEQLDRLFQHWWPELERPLSEIEKPKLGKQPKKSESDSQLDTIETSLSSLLGMMSDIRSEVSWNSSELVKQKRSSKNRGSQNSDSELLRFIIDRAQSVQSHDELFSLDSQLLVIKNHTSGHSPLLKLAEYEVKLAIERLNNSKSKK